MKISNCPTCGKEPTVIMVTCQKRTQVSCSGLLQSSHAPIRSGWQLSKSRAVQRWNQIVTDIHAKSDRKCVNGNCSIKATCGRYHQAANVSEARGAGGLYDRHSCRKGKCDHHLAKGVQP